MEATFGIEPPGAWLLESQLCSHRKDSPGSSFCHGSTVPKLLVAPGELLVSGLPFARDNDDNNQTTEKNYHFWAPFLSRPLVAYQFAHACVYPYARDSGSWKEPSPKPLDSPFWPSGWVGS